MLKRYFNQISQHVRWRIEEHAGNKITAHRKTR